MSRLLRNVLLLTGVASLGAYQLTRAYPLRSVPEAQPATSYQAAIEQIEALERSEDLLHNRCQPRLLTHGSKADRAIAFIHGYTNCPHQFSQLAPRFFEQGYNVYVARLPKHGLAERLSPHQGNLSAGALVSYTSQIVDMLCGLGEQTTLLGFSLGGVLAAWAAQQRRELDHVVLVSPALAVKSVPIQQQLLYANLLTLLPDQFRWWDPQVRDAAIEPLHAYPRWSTRSVGAMLRLAKLVQREAEHAPPAAKAITLITNPSDETVDNRGAEQLAAAWRKQGAKLRTCSFRQDWKLIHDLIDPEQPEQQVARVYPQLLEWAGLHPA